MTGEEALELLKTAPTGDEPSKVNPGLTMTKAVEIVRVATELEPPGKVQDHLSEKRIWQVVKNQRRPRYG